jgi:hypothetical protein
MDIQNPPHFHVKYNDHRALIYCLRTVIIQKSDRAVLFSILKQYNMVWVVKAELQENYRVYVEFNDGVRE